MRRLVALVALGALTVAALARPAVGAPEAAAVVAQARVASSLVDLIADLGDVNPTVRKAASQKLALMSRVTVVAQAVALVTGKAEASESESRMFSPASVALDLIVRLDPTRAEALALDQVETNDPDLRETSAAIAARLDDARALPFLVRALRDWGGDSVAGLRPVILGLSQGGRADTPEVRAVIVSVLETKSPPTRQSRFVYPNDHEPPQEGDRYRCWLFKADACLGLVVRHPFPAAEAGVRRCLLLDELRTGAALALARLDLPDAGNEIRSWLGRDNNIERRLGLYRALFVLGKDETADRLAARDLFTSTQAPSPAWIEGLRAMVDLFSRRADVPALRIVSSWKLRGEAASIRAVALDAMKAAHADVYARVLGSDYSPPGDGASASPRRER